MLSVHDLRVTYRGSILALRNVSLELPRGGVLAVLGSDGAGKTTLLRAISGVLSQYGGSVERGSIQFEGRGLLGRSPAAIVSAGVVQSPEGRRIFEGLTSGGQQRMLAIARALMSVPRLLLLDEPSRGLAPQVVGQIGRVVTEINAGGTAVILVERNAAMALSVATHAYVLTTGEVTLSGPARTLAADDTVRRLYLGHDTETADDFALEHQQ
jgi:ABC-type branched-subunit amino acid transport system ATPase component